MIQIELGYTLTDCYSGNANYGHAQQKQHVVKIDGELKNIFLKGFLNCPSDDGRYISYHKICDLTTYDLEILKKISEAHQEINWNTGNYAVYSKKLSKKQQKEIRDAESAYVSTLMRIFEPINLTIKLKTKKELKEFLKPLLTKKEYALSGRYFMIF